MRNAPPARASTSARRTSAAPQAARTTGSPLFQNSDSAAAFHIDGCPCGGGCPKCQANHNQTLQLKLETDDAAASKPTIVDGDPDGGTPTPAPKPAPAPTTPAPAPTPAPIPTPAPAAPTKGCPTSIKVAGIGNLNMDASFAEGGLLTGFGGFAIMEVSDASGKDWAGTAIHENLKSVKNTCGLAGACSNATGEGGAAGSTFKVGDASNLLGILPLPSKKNTFYDQHMVIIKGISLLHKAGLPSCELQCEQTYDCGGKQFGPTFLISYALKRDTMKSKAKSIDVTSVDMNVAAKP